MSGGTGRGRHQRGTALPTASDLLVAPSALVRPVIKRPTRATVVTPTDEPAPAPLPPPVHRTHARAVRPTVVGVVVAALASVTVAVVALNSSDAHPAGGASAASRSAPSDPLPRVSDASAITQPPASTTPLAPGIPVSSGQDESDPFLLQTSGHYFLYTSNTIADSTHAGMNVPVASSTDFTTWGPVTDAMPVLPTWVEPGFTWAPDVHQFGSTYVLYFTGLVTGGNEQCIGEATSVSPTGPFTAASQPFICQSNLSGSIDARVFTDDRGANWMLWKSDQNAHGQTDPTTLWSQRLTANGLGLVGTPSALLSPDESWQGTIVEAPDMVEINGAYWLLYSANWFNQPAYGIGVAFCAGPAGPCTDPYNRPLLGSNAQGQGPGEASFFRNASGIWMLYTPIYATSVFPVRPVDITRVGFAPGTGPYLASGGPPPALRSSSASR